MSFLEGYCLGKQDKTTRTVKLYFLLSLSRIQEADRVQDQNTNKSAVEAIDFKKAELTLSQVNRITLPGSISGPYPTYASSCPETSLSFSYICYCIGILLISHNITLIFPVQVMLFPKASLGQSLKRQNKSSSVAQKIKKKTSRNKRKEETLNGSLQHRQKITSLCVSWSFFSVSYLTLFDSSAVFFVCTFTICLGKLSSVISKGNFQ